MTTEAVNLVQAMGKADRESQRVAQTVLNCAKEQAIDEVMVACAESLEQRLVVENKNFSLANSIDSKTIRITVHHDQREGTASVNSADDDVVRAALRDALELSRFSVVDDGLTMATAAQAPKAKKLDFLAVSEVGALSLEQLQAAMQAQLKGRLADSKIAVDRFEMGLVASSRALYSSRGVEQSEYRVAVRWDIVGMAIDGTEVSGMDYDSGFSFTMDYETKLDATIEGFCRLVKENLRPQKCPSYKGLVILSPRAVQDIILSTVLYNAAGRQVMDKKSRWIENVGREVASPLLSVCDHPWQPNVRKATSFDQDGVPTRMNDIINDGVLRQHLHSCYTAKKCSTETSAIAGGPFGLVVKAGDSSLDKMVRSHPQVLLVNRFSGNNDPVKGDFSGVAKSSRLYLNGQDQGAVRETMISGSSYEVLKNIVAVSRETRTVNGDFTCPYVMVDGVSVSGN